MIILNGEKRMDNNEINEIIAKIDSLLDKLKGMQISNGLNQDPILGNYILRLKNAIDDLLDQFK